MKTIVKTLALTFVAVATLGIISMPTTLLAQEKGATKLMKITTVEDLSKVEPGDTLVMTCPKCKDTFVNVVDKSLKGTPDLKTKQIHLCPTCETRVVFSGLGKASKDKLVHVCKTCGSQDVTCCLMKKSGSSTSDEMK